MEARVDRPAAVARLLDDLDALERAYSVGHHGRWSASRRASLVDSCLRDLFAAADPPFGTTLVALGGYGRRRLSPASDVDLLILHDGSRPEEIAAFAERVLYPLWDAGLTVGHGVRTPEESVALASERLDARTAMLDGRALVGDLPTWNETQRRVVELVRSESHAFAGALLADAVTSASVLRRPCSNPT
jgi:UTP:GlnB (protein PII) uridylyltransferase